MSRLLAAAITLRQPLVITSSLALEYHTITPTQITSFNITLSVVLR